MVYMEFMWKHLAKEVEIREQRMTWFGALQGFLWLSLSATLDNKWSCKQGFWLIIVVALVGLFVSFVIMYAGTATEEIREKLNLAKDNEDERDRFTNIQYVDELILMNMRFEGSWEQPEKLIAGIFALGWIAVIVCASTLLNNACLELEET